MSNSKAMGTNSSQLLLSLAMLLTGAILIVLRRQIAMDMLRKRLAVNPKYPYSLEQVGASFLILGIALIIGGLAVVLNLIFHVI